MRSYQHDIENQDEEKFEPVPLLNSPEPIALEPRSNWSRFFSHAPRYACYAAFYISVPALLLSLSYYESGTLPENRYDILKHYFGILGLETSLSLPMALINARQTQPVTLVIPRRSTVYVI